ncbi:transposase [Metallibacterium scheffleri]|uniref:transposase n=1 Tax=Metallibacterium scheffleri TaxID=993689 RepID=UPI003CCCD88A
MGSNFAGGHHTVCHSAREYVRGDVHSNTIEGFFSIVKRGINGIYHAVSMEPPAPLHGGVRVPLQQSRTGRR